MATPVTVASSHSAGTDKPNTPNVDYVLPELAAMEAKYEMIRDCLAGQEAIKKQGQKYLPKPDPANLSPENDARYSGYVTRALFYNVTANTTKGLVGQVFAAEPISEFPDQLDIMWYDVSGSGVSMEQQAKRSLTSILAYGRSGLLTDFPTAKTDGSSFTREEVNEGTARPVILHYGPNEVPNWRYRTIGAQSVLSMVVINETYVVVDDGFEIKHGKEKRILRLDDAGLYEIERWRKEDDNSEWAKEAEIIYPTDGAGKRLDYIPFTFIGAENNDASVDKPPMYDMACINIAHYRNSADYEDAGYMVGQPTPYFAGLTQDWVDNVLKGTIQLGSRGAVPLPEGASAGLIQTEGNGMIKEMMDKKEAQMIAIGAQLVEDKQVQRTLGEAKMQTAMVASVLTSCAQNVSQAYEQAIKWACAFYALPDEEVVYSLSTDFAIQRMDANERRQLMTEWTGGAISWSEYRAQLRSSGVATLDDDEAKAEIEEEQQASIDMDAANGLNPDGSLIENNTGNDDDKKKEDEDK